MMNFLAGVVLAILPGLITGWLLFTAVGWSMKRDDYARRYSPQPALAPTPLYTTAERVAAQAPPVVNVFVAPGLPPCQHSYGWERPMIVEQAPLQLPCKEAI